MSIEYQFTNSANWDLFWSEERKATVRRGVIDRFFPITPIAPGIALSSNVVAIWCQNTEAPKNWRFGARYFIEIETGITVKSDSPKTVLKTGKIYLNQIEIIEIPNYSSTFSLRIDIPYWHRSFDVKIWEYVGDNRNTIQRKLDELIGNPLS
ncbi:MAG: hypothetical protein QNJ64_08455 [Crocosphaera sp.]|nr:hypothetical protein [Crocosphaera sp.]